MKHYTVFFLIAVVFSLFAGCGQLEMPRSNQKTFQPSGMFVDATAEDFLRVQLDELKTCGQFEKGSFEELAVVVMPPRFPCRWYSNGCGGEFEGPNTIKISSHYYWKHELIHYFLYINTGDPDSDHNSDLYERCA